jgi:hypothetical protein
MQTELEETEEIKAYINQMTPTEKKALEIARRNLESSFDIEKSIGYLDWLKKTEEENS